MKLLSKKNRAINYKLTGRPAHDGLAQVDCSGRRFGALLRGSATHHLRGQPQVCFDAAALSLAVRQRTTAQTGPTQSQAVWSAHVKFDSAPIGAPGMQDGAF
jgi:hypothetical protein